jgi:hypothetical protein
VENVVLIGAVYATGFEFFSTTITSQLPELHTASDNWRKSGSELKSALSYRADDRDNTDIGTELPEPSGTCTDDTVTPAICSNDDVGRETLAVLESVLDDVANCDVIRNVDFTELTADWPETSVLLTKLPYFNSSEAVEFTDDATVAEFEADNNRRLRFLRPADVATETAAAVPSIASSRDTTLSTDIPTLTAPAMI